jgi:hypothetical protein
MRRINGRRVKKQQRWHTNDGPVEFSNEMEIFKMGFISLAMWRVEAVENTAVLLRLLYKYQLR